jgi:hypothetical protein
MQLVFQLRSEWMGNISLPEFLMHEICWTDRSKEAVQKLNALADFEFQQFARDYRKSESLAVSRCENSKTRKEKSRG